MLIGIILAGMFIAAIPWAVGLPVMRWHPAMQTREARRTYRRATYAVCLMFSAVSFFVPALIMVWFIPLFTAIWLDIHWYRISRSPAGRAALAFAKDEAEPASPMPRPPYYGGPFAVQSHLMTTRQFPKRQTEASTAKFVTPPGPANKGHRRWPWIVLAVIAIIAVGGAMGGNNTSSRTPNAAATGSALSSASAVAPVIYTVVNVVDGDTIDVTGSDDSAFRVRVIGIDAPEMSTCEGPVATQAMTALVLNQTVLLATGARDDSTSTTANCGMSMSSLRSRTPGSR